MFLRCGEPLPSGNVMISRLAYLDYGSKYFMEYSIRHGFAEVDACYFSGEGRCQRRDIDVFVTGFGGVRHIVSLLSVNLGALEMYPSVRGRSSYAGYFCLWCEWGLRGFHMSFTTGVIGERSPDEHASSRYPTFLAFKRVAPCSSRIPHRQALSPTP